MTQEVNSHFLIILHMPLEGQCHKNKCWFLFYKWRATFWIFANNFFDTKAWKTKQNLGQWPRQVQMMKKKTEGHTYCWTVPLINTTIVLQTSCIVGWSIEGLRIPSCATTYCNWKCSDDIFLIPLPNTNIPFPAVLPSYWKCSDDIFLIPLPYNKYSFPSFAAT